VTKRRSRSKSIENTLGKLNMELEFPNDKDDSFILKLWEDENPKTLWEKLNENPEKKRRFKRETLSETNLKDLEVKKVSGR